MQQAISLISSVKHTFKSEKNLLLYTTYIENLADRNLPPILSFSHLSDLLSIPAQTLQCMAFETHLFYKNFSVPKRSGGIRSISSPHQSLDIAHRWILENILKPAYPTFSNSVVGYVGGKSILDHVRPHTGSSQLIKLDLKDFFPSISFDEITYIFQEIGYVKSVAKTLAALTTLHNGLPQGAATSPYLSNIYLKEFDSQISEYCKIRNLIYTRYADDIVISAHNGAEIQEGEIKKIFDIYDLKINHAKTRLYKDPKQIRFITGLIVKNEEIRLPKSMRRNIRAQCHLFLKNLPQMTSGNFEYDFKKILPGWKNRNVIFDPTFPERILGKLNYWLLIEPNNTYAIRMKTELQLRLTEI